MKDKILRIRVDETFLSKLDYLRRIHSWRTIAETVRKIVEKEYRKEMERGDNLKTIENNSVCLCNSCCNKYPECESEDIDIVFGDGVGNDNICCCNKYEPIVEHDYDRGGYK